VRQPLLPPRPLLPPFVMAIEGKNTIDTSLRETHDSVTAYTRGCLLSQLRSSVTRMDWLVRHFRFSFRVVIRTDFCSDHQLRA
jgi:hypothetical protein